MSTIPTTLDAGAVPYTVVGAPKADGGALAKGCASPLSVILLNRGSRLYRGDAIGELEHAGLTTVLSVEPKPEALDVEALSAKHPTARFLLLSGSASPGVQINLAMRESAGPYVFVLWNDLSLAAQGLSSRFPRAPRRARRALPSALPLRQGLGAAAVGRGPRHE
jgi:hypothetical protein